MTEQEKKLISDYKATFSTDSGRNVLSHLKKMTNFGRSHFSSGPIDANALIYDEARRGLVLRIIQYIEANLEAAPQTTAKTQEIE